MNITPATVHAAYIGGPALPAQAVETALAELGSLRSVLHQKARSERNRIARRLREHRRRHRMRADRKIDSLTAELIDAGALLPRLVKKTWVHCLTQELQARFEQSLLDTVFTRPEAVESIVGELFARVSFRHELTIHVHPALASRAQVLPDRCSSRTDRAAPRVIADASIHPGDVLVTGPDGRISTDWRGEMRRRVAAAVEGSISEDAAHRG